MYGYQFIVLLLDKMIVTPGSGDSKGIVYDHLLNNNPGTCSKDNEDLHQVDEGVRYVI